MAIHLFFSSLTQGIIILNEDSNTTVMFWLVGSLKWIEMDCSLVSYAFAHISAYHNDVIRPSINHNGIGNDM